MVGRRASVVTRRVIDRVRVGEKTLKAQKLRHEAWSAVLSQLS